jgi:hypothetical protein
MAESDVPKKFDLTKGRVTPVADDVPAKFDLSKGKVTPVNDNTWSATPWEGTYKMYTPKGDVIDVSYSNVESLLKLGGGYDLTKDYRLKFVKDKAYDMKNKAKEKYLRPALNLLPTVGGIAGGLAAGGAGIETGLGAFVTGTVGAAAGGGLGEDVRQVATEKLFPNDTRMTPAESAKGMGVQAANQGISELTGRVGSRFVFNPAIKALRGTAEASEKAGFRLLPSEVKGTKPSIFETYPKASIFSSGTMAHWRELQNQETEKAARDLADSVSKMSLGKTASREEAGNIIRKGIEDHMAKFRRAQDAAYNRINKLAKNLSPSRTDMVAFAQKELNRLNASELAGGKVEMSPFRARLESIVNNKLPSAPYTAMKDLRSQLLSEARDDNALMSGTEKGFLKKMAGIVDTSIEDSMKKSGNKGLPQLWRTANNMTREEHEAFEKRLIENLAAKKNPEDIALVLRGNTPGAIAPIGIQETREAMKVIPKSMIPRVQKQILLDTMYESSKKGTESFNEKNFAKKILQIGDERGEVLFQKNWPKIREFAELLNKITESGGLSAATLSNPEVVKQVGRFTLEAVLSASGVYAAHGPAFTAMAVPIAGEAILWKSVAAALVHPEGVAKLLNGMRLLAKYVPYGVTAGINEAGGMQKGIEQVKAAGDKLKEKYAPTPAPAPAPAPPAAPVNITITHEYNTDTEGIDPIE